MARSYKPRAQYVFAQYTASVREPGSKYPTTVHEGTAWHADCPLVQAHPRLFAEEPPVVHPRNWVPRVEQATSAPGEVRDTDRA